ncbi:MAG: hypothetical protein CL930_09765 [Deltaproteobacteria bacterium]|nr:hypothetical protein [Deltaproteobacteria bacterium]|tara:strand:+ start:289 stop:801 length:513 start_codon:yes stop_codon:yes gene_type:complete
MNRLKQILALMVLLVFGGYHVACFVQYRDFAHTWRPSLLTGTNVFWLARWKMFTGLSTWHTEPEFQVRYIDTESGELSDWTHFPMAERYPARWESGYRWERPAVYKRQNVLEKFLELPCRQDNVVVVRMIKHRWKATLGQLEQPKKRYKSEPVGGLRCDQSLPSPKGIRL